MEVKWHIGEALYSLGVKTEKSPELGLYMKGLERAATNYRTGSASAFVLSEVYSHWWE